MNEEATQDRPPSDEQPWSGVAISGFVVSLIGFVVPYGSLTSILLSSIGLAFTSQGKKRGRALAGWGLALGILNAGIGAVIGGVQGYQIVSAGADTETAEVSESTVETMQPLSDRDYRCLNGNSESAVATVSSGRIKSLTASIDLALTLSELESRWAVYNPEYDPIRSNQELVFSEMEQISNTSFSVVGSAHRDKYVATFTCE